MDDLPYREIERRHAVPAATAQARCERALAFLRATARGQPVAALPRTESRSRFATDARGAVTTLWALAEADGGLLPTAARATAILGLGRRSYDALVARLESAGCLGGAKVSFASRQGRRRRVAVSLQEALRRLDPGAPGGGWAASAIMPARACP